MARYTIEPVGNAGGAALYNIVDTTLAGFNTTICSADIRYAKKITDGLNLLEMADTMTTIHDETPVA